jgi:hypothetical protein
MFLSRDVEERRLRRLYKSKIESPKWKMFFEDVQQQFVWEYSKTYTDDIVLWTPKTKDDSLVTFFIETFTSYVGFQTVYEILLEIVKQKSQQRCFHAMSFVVGNESVERVELQTKCYVCRKHFRSIVGRGMCHECNPTHTLLSWKKMSARRKRCFESTFEFILCLRRLGICKDLIRLCQQKVLDTWRDKEWK